jgi:hypothetical protein
VPENGGMIDSSPIYGGVHLPRNGWFIYVIICLYTMENPLETDDLGVPPF